MLRYFAEIEDGKVSRVIVAPSIEWCESRLGGTWEETADPYSDELQVINYAGPGYAFDVISDEQFYVAAPDTFTLWDASLDPAPIFVPNGVAPRTLEAANLLADYVEQSSGKTKPTVTQQPAGDPVPARAILVGYEVDTRVKEETIISRPAERKLLLTGADEFDPSNPDLIGQETESNYMLQAGTYHAVMTFLHEFMGLVWGWPGDLGTAVPSMSELKVSPVFKRKAPDTRARSFMGFSRPGNASPYSFAKEWLKYQRCFWATQVNTGHGFRNYYDRFHPDGNPGGDKKYLFALQPDGSRNGPPAGKNIKMEIGEPDLIDVWFNVNVEEALISNPLKKTFSCAFNDAHSTGHSVDPRALAMGPTFTDREVQFSNNCADRLGQEYPDAFAVMLAYGPSRVAPEVAIPRDNVIVANAANDFSNPDADSGFAGNTHKQNFDDWLEVYPKNQIWRPNLGNGHGHMFGMWMTQVHQNGNRLRDRISRGCTGIAPDGLWEHWSTQWPMYYCISQLLWDRRKTVDEVMDQAYNTLFGPASSHVKDYYEATETAIENYTVHSINIRNVPDLWNQSLIDQLQVHLDSAAAAVVTDSDEEKRVEWVQAGLDWCKAVKRAAKYLIEWEAPGVVTNTTNLATQSNAIESDVDGTAGWSPMFNHVSAEGLSSQSNETNGSAFAFFMDANTHGNGSPFGFVRDPLPGTESGTYLVTIDVKHVGVGGRWKVENLGNGAVLIVNADDTEWKRGGFIAKGGDVVRIRELNDDRDGAIYVDNMLIQEAAPTNQDAIEVDWQAHIDAAISAATDPAWEIPPVSPAVTNNGGNGRIPSPGNQGEPDPEPGFQ